MNLADRQYGALTVSAGDHRPTHKRTNVMRKHLQQKGIANVVPEERLAARRRIANAVGDPFFNERLIGTMDLLSVNFLERGAAVARSVCRLELKDEVGRTDGYATGILVGENLLLTNHHVFPTADHARRSLAQFNYAEDARGQPLPSHSFKLDPDRFFCSDKTLDYALVGVSPASLDDTPLATFGASTLVYDTGKAILSEHLNIIQHPRGQTKQVAIRHNELTEEKGDFLYYLADTDHGSSGSAVYNDAWIVVALHIAGVPEIDARGRYIEKTTGKPIQGKPASLEDVRYIANRGVRVSRIYEHLKARPDLKDEQQSLALSVFKSLDEFIADPLRGTSLAPRTAALAPLAPLAPAPEAALVERMSAEGSEQPHQKAWLELEIDVAITDKSGQLSTHVSASTTKG